MREWGHLEEEIGKVSVSDLMDYFSELIVKILG